MKKSKKILLISNNGIGFYNFKKELIQELLSMNYEVHFAVPYYEKLSELISSGAKYHELNIDRRGMNPIKDMGLLKQLRKIINGIKPNIIISHTIKPNIYASILARCYNIPYINNITGLGSALQLESSIMAKIIIFLYRISLYYSDGIFFENVGNMNFFERNHIGRKSKYILVPGAGVNTEHFNMSSYTNKSNTLAFLYIARISVLVYK